ncbi:MAG: hypothetical protein FWC43_03715 [Planctomycetaceae bacterium]|nr:hypothetical protein [Planctomycetaceae bacterium]
MNNEEFQEFQDFESELRKLKPAKFQHVPHQSRAQSKRLRQGKRSLPEYTPGLPLTPCAALIVCASILLGMLLGAGLVHFLQQPVIIEKVVVEYVESPPMASLVDQPIRTNIVQAPISIDTMISQYNQRSKLLADLPVSRTSSRSFTPSWPDDPNSLLKLREQMIF